LIAGTNENAIRVNAGSNDPVDITTSDAFTDLRILTGGDLDFNPLVNPKTAIDLNKNTKYPNFLFITGKPYAADLYLYFSFVNYPFGFNWQANATNYAIEAAFGTGNETTPTFSTCSLTQVGNAANYGNTHFAKYVVRNAFSNTAIGAENYYAINSFGTVANATYFRTFDVQSRMTFSYSDSTFDMVADFYKPAVAVVKNKLVRQYQKLDVGAYLAGEDDGASGLTEMDFGLFNLDAGIPIDRLLSINVSYNYLTYTREGYYSSQGLYDDHPHYYCVPTGMYDESDAKCKLVSNSAHSEWISATDTVTVTLSTGVGLILPWWITQVDHTFKKLIDLDNPGDIDSVELAALQKMSVSADAKGDTTRRRFAFLAQTNDRTWTGKLYPDPNWWAATFNGSYWKSALCHNAEGDMVQRVIFMSNGIVYDYNAFDTWTEPVAPLTETAELITPLDFLKYKLKEPLDNLWKILKIIGIVAGAVVGGGLVLFGSYELYKQLSGGEGQ